MNKVPRQQWRKPSSTKCRIVSPKLVVSETKSLEDAVGRRKLVSSSVQRDQSRTGLWRSRVSNPMQTQVSRGKSVPANALDDLSPVPLSPNHFGLAAKTNSARLRKKASLISICSSCQTPYTDGSTRAADTRPARCAFENMEKKGTVRRRSKSLGVRKKPTKVKRALSDNVRSNSAPSVSCGSRLYCPPSIPHFRAPPSMTLIQNVFQVLLLLGLVLVIVNLPTIIIYLYNAGGGRASDRNGYRYQTRPDECEFSKAKLYPGKYINNPQSTEVTSYAGNAVGVVVAVSSFTWDCFCAIYNLCAFCASYAYNRLTTALRYNSTNPLSD